MLRCRFVDADATLFKAGTEEWLPGVKEQLEKWHAAGDMIVLFTMRPPGPWFDVVRHCTHGYMQKPCADEYYLYDDKLVEGRQSICCPHSNREVIDGKPYCRDCDIWLYPDEILRTRTAEDSMKE
jgi:hypothetical protein